MFKKITSICNILVLLILYPCLQSNIRALAEQPLVVALESIKTNPGKLDVQWLFARLPGTNVRVVGHVKVTRMLGSEDTIVVVRWLGVQDHKNTRQIAKLSKPISSQWLSHHSRILKSQPLELKNSKIINEAIVRLQRGDTMHFDLSKGPSIAVASNQWMGWVSAWLNIGHDSDSELGLTFNKETQDDMNHMLDLKNDTNSLS